VRGAECVREFSERQAQVPSTLNRIPRFAERTDLSGDGLDVASLSGRREIDLGGQRLTGHG
jgi:hypothetical protein